MLLSSELRQYKSESELELDFNEILVMTPSWLGEFVNTLNSSRINKIAFSHLENASVKSSVEMTQMMGKLSSSEP